MKLLHPFPTLRAVLLSCAVVLAAPVHASDHLDAPTATADPAGDIGDLSAGTSVDGHRLNLAPGHRRTQVLGPGQ
jgi:hypothetical protein